MYYVWNIINRHIQHIIPINSNFLFSSENKKMKEFSNQGKFNIARVVHLYIYHVHVHIKIHSLDEEKVNVKRDTITSHSESGQKAELPCNERVSAVCTDYIKD